MLSGSGTKMKAKAAEAEQRHLRVEAGGQKNHRVQNKRQTTSKQPWNNRFSSQPTAVPPSPTPTHLTTDHLSIVKNRMTTQPLCILGEKVVEDYKYLVVHLDKRLNWEPTLTPYTRWVWADSISRGGWDLSAHAARCWRDSPSLLPSTLFFAEVCWGSIICIGTFNSWINRTRRSAP